MDFQPKTRQEKKGKDSKNKDPYNKKTVRQKEANLALAVARVSKR